MKPTTKLRQLSEAEAIAMADSEVWRRWTAIQKALFQVHQAKLCMPWTVFHGAVADALRRPVITFEFADAHAAGGIADQLAALENAPTMEALAELIPQGS